MYEVKEFPHSSSFDGYHVQRDIHNKYYKVESIKRVAKIIKKECDLRHAVLSMDEWLNEHIKTLQEQGKVEILMKKPKLLIIEKL